MTISRKEFEGYSKALVSIQDMTIKLRGAGWWRGAFKAALEHDITRACSDLESKLAARVSKPRPRNPVEIANTGSHDA